MTLNAKIGDFMDFWRFRTATQVQRSLGAPRNYNSLCDPDGWIDWQFANRNCYWLSRVAWALAQISCY